MQNKSIFGDNCFETLKRIMGEIKLATEMATWQHWLYSPIFLRQGGLVGEEVALDPLQPLHPDQGHQDCLNPAY